MKDSLLSHVHYLSSYLRPHKKVVAFSFLLSGLSTALGLSQPLFAKVLIDKVFLGNSSHLLLPLLLALIVLLIISFAIRMGNSFLYTSYSAKLLFTMREDLFAHVQRAPLSFFAKNKIGDIYSRIASDMADVQGLITETVPHFLFNLLTCVITTIILLWLHWKMALLSFCFLPVALYSIHWIRPRLLELAKQVAESNADIAHFLFESLSSASLIRAFGAEAVESEKLKERHAYLLEFLLRHQTLRVFSGSVPTIMIIINTLVVFGYGGFLVITGTLSIGSLIAFSIYQGRAFSPLQGLMDGFLALQKAKVSLQRVNDILKITPAFAEEGNVVLQEGNLRGEIAFKNVSFAYEPGEPVLENLSFQIPAGKITAVTGPSGVGKSTICHMILRLFDPDQGRVTLDGIDLKSFKIDWLRKHVALVAQDTFLFHTTIRENIRFSKPHARDEEIVEAAKAAGIHDFIQSLPRGYATVVGDRGVRLSGGQKQRISIARSILSAPKILILDEATAFLDSLAEERLKDTLRFLMKGRTLLVISHRPSAIQDADSIIALSPGHCTVH
ncbi:MAG: ABC transporter ATP-binding protein [Pseudomonadota bacterium]